MDSKVHIIVLYNKLSTRNHRLNKGKVLNDPKIS